VVTADLQAVVDEVAGAGCCRHPIRLFGTALDRRTGELAERTVVIGCKDRRAVLCPACAAVYQADAWQLVAAGLRGGKGVPGTVAEHPRCFVTLTAPSFGPVHSRSRDAGHPRPCRRRQRAVVCSHGVLLACNRRHGDDDPLLGRPLCPGCFDYDGAVVWNAVVSLLWQRTSVAVAREVARAGGVPMRGLADVLRLSYLKVVEFQRRGLVHLHVVVRADGPAGPSDKPPAWLEPELLAGAVMAVAGRVAVPDPLGRGAGVGASAGAGGGVGAGWRTLGWGRERSVKVLAAGDPAAVAAYVAKYATKTATDEPVLARRVDGGRIDGRRIDRGRVDAGREPVLAGVDPHLATLTRTAWRLGGRAELADLNLRAHAHTFGYRGHFATKSRRYSTTFGALRQARADHARQAAAQRDGAEGAESEGPGVEADGFEGAETVDEVWRYAGRGYRTAAAERLAEALAEGIATRPRPAPAGARDTSPEGSPLGSPGGLHFRDQGR
jgi:hypothetical protein